MTTKTWLLRINSLMKKSLLNKKKKFIKRQNTLKKSMKKVTLFEENLFIFLKDKAIIELEQKYLIIS